MKNFKVNDSPEYSEEMRMLETTDPTHADVFNKLFAQLINNDAFLNKLAAQVAEHAKQAQELATRAINDSNGTKIDIAGITGNLASLRKTVYLGKAGTFNLLDFPAGASGIIAIDRVFNNTAPQSTILAFNTHFYGTGSGRQGSITQLSDLSEQFANIAFRITHDGSIEHLEMVYNSNTVNELNITVGVIAAQISRQPVINFHEVTEDRTLIYQLDVCKNAGVVASRAIMDGTGKNIAEQFAALGGVIFRNPTTNTGITRDSIVIFDDGGEHTLPGFTLSCDALVITNSSKFTFNGDSYIAALSLTGGCSFACNRLVCDYAYVQGASLTILAGGNTNVNALYSYTANINLNGGIVGDLIVYGYDGAHSDITLGGQFGNSFGRGSFNCTVIMSGSCVVMLAETSSKNRYTVAGNYTFITPFGVDTGSALNTVSLVSEDDEEEFVPAPEDAEEDFKNDFLFLVPHNVRRCIELAESGGFE